VAGLLVSMVDNIFGSLGVAYEWVDIRPGIDYPQALEPYPAQAAYYAVVNGTAADACFFDAYEALENPNITSTTILTHSAFRGLGEPLAQTTLRCTAA
jgi:hypothetical protein